jgi:hypothetical protein
MVIGGCLLAAIVLDQAFSAVLSSLDAVPPRWLLQMGLWLPGGVGLRIANAFGYRFEVSRWDAMGPFVIATEVIGCVVWAAALFILVGLVRRISQPRHGAAAA